MATNQMNDETRLGLAADRIKQAADLLATARKLIAGGEYANCQEGTYRHSVLVGIQAILPQLAEASGQTAKSAEYVKQRLNNAPSA